MKHIWTILCQSSAVDIKTNLLSLFDCVEEITLGIDKAKAPKDKNLIIPVKFQLVSFWIVEDQNKENVLEVKNQILDPDGTLLSESEQKFDIKQGIKRFRTRIMINNFTISKEGVYIIKILQRKEEKKGLRAVTEVPIDVKITYKN
jgi:hypothetical protein